MVKVKRSRELGLLRLGQPLKSFRDHIGDFKIYKDGADRTYLDSLGPLIKPNRVDELAKLKLQEKSLELHEPGTEYKRNIEEDE
jgi:hypothetical protein